MGKGLLLVMLAGICNAEQSDMARCADIAGRYQANPFAIRLGELDELRQCISWQMAEIAQAPERERAQRAARRNFATMKDAEE